MLTSIRKFAGAALLAGVSTAIVPSAAAPIGHPFVIERPSMDLTQPVYRPGGWGWGPGAFVGGLAAGAIIDRALAAPYRYGSPYYYGPGYLVPAYSPPPGDAVLHTVLSILRS